MIFLSLVLATFAHAKDCKPIACELRQEGTSLAKLSLRQEASDDDKCMIFVGGNEITLANGKEKVTFSAGEEAGKVTLSLDFTDIEGQQLFGAASVETTRRALAADPVKLSASYYGLDGKQQGFVELECKRK